MLGYCDQALAGLDDKDTPMRTIARRFDVGDQRARTLLAGAGLAIEKQSRPIAQLSGGQKARLGMLVLRLTEPNFYLLDEPTNHLDIEGQEALEEELLDHAGKLPAGLARPQFCPKCRQPVLADRAEEAGGAR